MLRKVNIFMAWRIAEQRREVIGVTDDELLERVQ